MRESSFRVGMSGDDERETNKRLDRAASRQRLEVSPGYPGALKGPASAIDLSYRERAVSDPEFIHLSINEKLKRFPLKLLLL